MDVTKQWLSQSNGCHKVVDVTKQWLSQSNGCGSLARKLRFHIFNFHLLRGVSSNGYHKAMAVTEQRMPQSNGCHQAMAVTEQWMSQRFGGRSRTKALFSHLQLSLFEGRLARKLRFHIFHFNFLREVSHEMRF